jgi:hypothetical protein
VRVEVQKQSEEQSADEELREEWLRHPFTQSRREALEREAGKQLTELFGACEKSTDPEVRGQYRRYIELSAMAIVFKRGGKK